MNADRIILSVPARVVVSNYGLLPLVTTAGEWLAINPKSSSSPPGAHSRLVGHSVLSQRVSRTAAAVHEETLRV